MTARARLAAHFKAHPYEWISALDLMQLGGLLAWRTRTSELRHAPYFMTIENDLHAVTKGEGRGVLHSRYRYVPSVPRQVNLPIEREEVAHG